MAVRVLVVDDHAPFRALARELLELDRFVVVGEAGNAADALDLARQLSPDLVLLDIGLPDADGFDVASRLAASDAAPMVVLISSRDSSAYRRRLASSPVRGFLPKDELSAAALAGLLG
ncbi:MAG: response regulator transcription factor [Actinomycetota bacterium]|nr:response regulator transcription factor [Actinomycetota bacterium]